MVEKIIVWLFLIGTSGTAKSALMKKLTMSPLLFGVIPAMKVLNQRIKKDHAKAVTEYSKKRARSPIQMWCKIRRIP